MLKVKKKFLSDLNIKSLDQAGLSYEDDGEYLSFDEDSSNTLLNAQSSGNINDGFIDIASAEYIKFFIDNQQDIINEFKDWADGQGEGLLEMISNFANMKNFTLSEIGEALFTRMTPQEVKEFNMDLINYSDPMFEIREGLGLAIIEDFCLFRLESLQENTDEETEE